MERSSPEWDLDSDEIASVTSQDLNDNRPNRWTGSQSTWREFTQEERRLWQSMKMLEDRDLAIHLYNAHALKRHGKDPETAQDLTVTMENGQQGIWAPPRVWTAWPLNEKRVPEQWLLRGEDDEDDKYTFRKAEKRMPSSELQDELAATILRQARERFNRRKRKQILASVDDEAATSSSEEEHFDQKEGPEINSSGSSSSSSPSDEGISGSEKDEKAIEEDAEAEENMDYETTSQSGRAKRKTPKTYDPVMSSNDDLSYELIRPSVRHILSQFDDTLRILHNARVATADYASDSSATDEESDTQFGTKRGRGRPRSTSQAPDLGSSPQPDSAAPTPRKRGRPKKVHVPLPGETHEEMLIRIARKGHRRLPPASSQNRDSAFEEWLRKGDEMVAQEEALQKDEEELGIDPGADAQERRIRRLGLRDWSDVVGAAALAGFSQQVIARTAKRCANLFGEGMVVRRLDEIPASKGPAFHSAEYRPEKIHLSDLDDIDDDTDADNESEADTALSSRRSLSRQPSLLAFHSLSRRPSPAPLRGRSSPHSPSPFTPQQQQQHQHHPTRSKSRSRSRSSAGLHLCPIPSCERSVTGFSRRQNLKRHMQLVHPSRQEGDMDDKVDEEWDSGNEVLGAVHVDGFLKPILPSRGWRESIVVKPKGGKPKKKKKKKLRMGGGGMSLESESVSDGDYSS